MVWLNDDNGVEILERNGYGLCEKLFEREYNPLTMFIPITPRRNAMPF